MSLEFLKIYGRNFNSFKDFELQVRPGIHLITGENRSSSTESSNGSGKSSICDSLDFTLFRDYKRGKDPSRDFKGDCMTGVLLRRGGSEYRVEQYYRDTSYGDDVKVFQDDSDISEDRKTDTYSLINNIIGIDKELFHSTVFIAQDLPSNFCGMTPTVRKQIIEGLLGFDKWDSIRKRSLGKRSVLQSEVKNLKSDIKKLELEESSLLSREKEIREMLDRNKEKFLEEKSALEQRIEGTRDSIEDLEKELGGRKSEGIPVEKTRSYLRDVNQEIISLKNTIGEGICSQCGQEYPRDRIDDAKKKISLLTSKASTIKEQINGMEKTRNEVQKFEKALQQKKFGLLEMEKSLSRLEENSDDVTYEKKLSSISQSLEEVKSRLESLSSERDGLQKKIKAYGILSDSLKPSSHFRSWVLSSYLSRLNEIIAGITPLIFDDFRAELRVNSRGSGIEINVEKSSLRKSTEKTLSGGERHRFVVIMILALQRFYLEQSGMRANLVIFDEVFDHLDDLGVECCMKALHSLFPEEAAIYIISHKPWINLDSVSHDSVHIIKDNNVSRIDSQ